MKRVDKLFIIQTANMTGGGSQSVRGLIRNLDEKVDLLVNTDHGVSNGALKKFYGKNVRNIYRYHLPFRRSAAGLKLNKNGVKKWCIREMDYLRDKKKIYALIRLKKYRFIHLNSYVLYPLLTSRFPMFIHIREIFEGSFLTHKIAAEKLRQAKGIIYIDHAVKESFGQCNEKEIVLNNPFNQSAVLDVNPEEVCGKFRLQCGKTYFSFVLARPDKVKGLDYVIEEFIRAGCKESGLLVVGIEAPDEYRNAPNVHFLGRVEKMHEIYAISDVVVRGEPEFCVGRTIYEALYSGCHVIIPGTKGRDKDKVFEYDRFSRQVMFYEPRERGALTKRMAQLDGMKKERCLGLSNEKEYKNKFYEFIGGTEE